MSYRCEECDRGFPHPRALEQHFDDSTVHRYDEYPEYECESCYDTFMSIYERELHHIEDHYYCKDCRRFFQNENNLNQHLHSKIHNKGVTCPWCKETYATASGLTVHLESGRCTTSSLNRNKINKMVQDRDTRHIITKPMITMPGYTSASNLMATEASWNGQQYVCCLCYKGFARLPHLNQHLASPAHEQSIYHCPKTSCGAEFKALSSLIMHVESESCGIMRFNQVQSQARNGLQNMIGRMIQL